MNHKSAPWGKLKREAEPQYACLDGATVAAGFDEDADFDETADLDETTDLDAAGGAPDAGAAVPAPPASSCSSACSCLAFSCARSEMAAACSVLVIVLS